MERQIGKFVALDKGKQSRTLYLFQEYKYVGNHDDADAQVATFQRIRTANGSECSRKEKGVYQILVTGEILTSDDPNAP